MQSECTIRLNNMNNIGRENDCASTLSDHQLLELGRLVCFNNDGLFALIDKLNVNQPGMGHQPDPGYRVLKAWINKGSGTTLRFLRTVFTEMLRIDLVNMLDDFIKDFMTLLLVIHFENGVCEVRLNVRSSELVADVVEGVVRKNYLGMIEKSTSTVKMLGKEYLENIKCLTFKGAQLDIHVKQNEAMKSITSYDSSKYSLDDPVAKLSAKYLEELGKSIDTSTTGSRDCLRLAHILGEKIREGREGCAKNLLKKWAEWPHSTFRILEQAFIEMERIDLRNMLQIFMNDSMDINILLIHMQRRINIREKVNSQCKILEILRRVLKSRSPLPKPMLCKVIFQVGNKQLTDDVRCEEYKNQQVRVETVIDETKDSRNWPSLDVSLFRFCGFRDVTRSESESLLQGQENGKFILRYRESRRYHHEGKYAISLVLNNLVYHLLLFEHEDDNDDKLYYLTENGFHSPNIPSLLEYFRTHKLKFHPDEFYLQPLW